MTKEEVMKRVKEEFKRDKEGFNVGYVSMYINDIKLHFEKAFFLKSDLYLKLCGEFTTLIPYDKIVKLSIWEDC